MGGCLFWQGSGGSALGISSAGSRDQGCDPSAPGVLLNWLQRAFFTLKMLREPAQTGPAVNGFTVTSQPTSQGALLSETRFCRKKKSKRGNVWHQQSPLGSYRAAAGFTELINSLGQAFLHPQDAPQGSWRRFPAHRHPYPRLQPPTAPRRRKRWEGPHHTTATAFPLSQTPPHSLIKFHTPTRATGTQL